MKLVVPGLLAAVALAMVLLGSCEAPETTYYLTGDELLDPAACEPCHPDHYREWAGSMHAYTAVDPLFRAVNAHGQEQTDGAMGSYCVSCHHPLAHRRGATTDGLDLDEVDPNLLGVNCYYCHVIEHVAADHNVGHVLADDEVMRGAYNDPVPNDAHASGYSMVHDRINHISSELCGTCHCVFNPNDVHVERTFHEWRETIFATYDLTRQTCGICHMRGRDAPIATGEDMPVRRYHDHSFVGIDTAITEFPNRAEQAALIQAELDISLFARLCVLPAAGGVDVVARLENVAAGHNFPSGVSADRRVWVEIKAWSGDDLVFTSGVVDEGVAITSLDDPWLWLLRDTHYGADGQQVDWPWLTHEVVSEGLTAPVTTDPSDPAYYHYQERSYPIDGVVPDRVSMRVRLRPVGFELIDELIAAGHLDPTLRDAFPPTWELRNTHLVWDGDVGSCIPY